MNREHYNLLAKALSTQPDTELKYELILELIEMLKDADTLFRSELFIEASENRSAVILHTGSFTDNLLGDNPLTADSAE